MHSVRTSIAQNVATQLWEAERKNDQAMASTARLIATAIDARLKLRAAACVGQSALEAMTAAISQQAVSRRMLIDAHEALNQAKDAMGMLTLDFGGGGDKEVPPGLVVKLATQRAA